MTKKEIYAKYDIMFEKDHILYNGNWICELLKEGNTKTGKRVYTFSLPAGTNGTCVCDCIGCYAQTGRYNAENVQASMKLNQSIVENDIDFFYRAITAQLEKLAKGK